MKKIMASVLAAAMIMGAGTATAYTGADTVITANAATNGTYENLKYTAYDTYVAITGFDGTVTEVEIPAEIDGLPVTTIAEGAFKNCSSLEKVTISKGITDIKNEAFYQCTSLTSISLPDTLVSIGNHCFYKAISLQAIDIPENTTSIGNYAFGYCVTIQELVFPKNTKQISKLVAGGCSNLRTVTINNGPTDIGQFAFDGCTSLESIYIPISITDMNYMGENCPLENIYYAGNEIQWKTVSNKTFISSVPVHFGAENLQKPLTPDVNRDGAIDASDASCILAYYAYTMTGGTGTIEEFLAK